MRTGPGRLTGNLLCAAFLLAEAVLFGWIVWTTFSEGSGDKARMASIVVCAAFALVRFALTLLKECGRVPRSEDEEAGTGSDTAEEAFLLSAFIFSSAADRYLIFDPEKTLSAVLIFCVAQVFHALRIMAASGMSGGWLFARAVLLLTGGAVLAIMKVRDPLIYAGTFYILNLAVSFARSIGLAGKKRSCLILPAGLFLFILCDITVGIRGMGPSWDLPERLVSVASDLTYIFYVPSQVLIALSGLEFRRREASWKTS